MLIRSSLALLIPVVAGAANSPFRELFFEPNLGQAAPGVRYVARTAGANIAVTDDGLTFDLAGGRPAKVRMRLAGTSSKARFEPLDESSDRTSYFIGADSSRWIRGVPQYRRLAWRDVYPGVDLIFYGRDGRLEYDCIVAPGADPGAIQLAFDHSARLAIGRAGDLQVHSGRSGFELRKPLFYQRLDGGAQRAVDGWYRLGARGRVRFEAGRYDRGRTLVIDPVVSFSSYYGGEKDDSVVALTPFGDIVGVTSSLAFGIGTAHRCKDIFAIVVPQHGAGRQLMIIGGSDDDVATSAAADTDILVIGGWTRSTDLIRNGGFGGSDGFLLSIDRSGRFFSPVIARVGGSGEDRINAVWGTGTTYFAGETTSPDLTLGGQPLQTQLAGGSDAFFGWGFSFIGTLSPNFLAYFGGSGDDAAYAITGDGAGRVVIAGKTASPDLPTKDPLSAQLSGPSDAFVARFNPAPGAAPSLEFSTYLGGSGKDEIRGLAVFAPGSVYFAGTTTSTDLPLVNPAQPQFGGGESDAFAGQIDLDARKLVFNTYIGGSGRDEGAAIAFASSYSFDILSASPLSEPVVAGSTTSPDLPVLNAVQNRLNGPQDAFLAHFDSAGGLQSLSYFGGSGTDRGLALSVSVDNIATIGGETDSADLPTAARNDTPSVQSGGLDGFTAGVALTRFAVVGQDLTHWTGKDMTVYESIFLSADIPATAVLTLTSSDPSRVLASFDPAAPVSASVSLPVAALFRSQGRIRFYLTGLAESGESTVTITLDGFRPFQIRVRLAPVAIFLSISNRGRPATVGDLLFIFASLGVVTDNGQIVYGILRPGASAVTVNLSLSNPAIASLSAPTILAGDPSVANTTFLTATASGETTLLASSNGIPLAEPASIPFSIVYPVFTLPDFNLGKNLEVAASFRSINGATNSSLALTVTSEDPQRVCLVNSAPGCAGSLVVAGDSPFFSVRGLADSGSVQLRYSGVNVQAGSTTVHLTRPKIFLDTIRSLLTAGNSYNFGVSYGAATDVRGTSVLRSGFDPGLTITSSDPKIVSVTPGTLQRFSVRAVAPGHATLTASAPGFDSDPITIAVEPLPAPAFNASTTRAVIGKDLQALLTVSATIPAPQVRIASSDPALLLVSTDSSSPGGAQATSKFGNSTFYLQALAGSGSAAVTLSAPGVPDLTIPVNLAPSGFAWTTSAAALNAHSNTQIFFTSFMLDPDSLAPILSQPLRPGVTVRPDVTSSDPGAGDFTISGATVTFAAGGPGTAVLSLGQPDGFLRPLIRNDVRVTINPAALSARVPLFLGKDLQTSFTAFANNTQGQLPITVRSDDPSRILISSGASLVGGAQIDTATTTPIYLQALAASGTVLIRISGPGIDEAVYPVTLAPTGVGLVLNSTGPAPIRITTLSPDLSLSAALFAGSTLLNSSSGIFTLRPGIGPLQVAVTSTQPEVARTLSSMLTFNPGQASSVTFAVRPLSPGDTVIRLAPPASFHTTSGFEEVAVKVVQPSFTRASLTVARDFENPASLQLDSSISLPSTIVVTLTSNDPSRLLLSTGAEQPGQARISVAYSNGSARFFLQGIAEGQTTVTATSSGFDDTAIDVSVTRPSLSLSGPQTAVVNQPSQASVNFDSQSLRPGARVSVNLHSSDPGIATVDSPVIADSSQARGLAAIHPVAAGTTTITADLPDGFTDGPGARSFNLTVTLPSLPFNTLSSTYLIGKNLQVSQPLFQTGSGPVNLTVSSSDSSKVLVSADATKAGQAAVSISAEPSRTTQFYIQALADSGSATLTFSAPGYRSLQATVNLYPSAFAFSQALVNATQANPFDFPVSLMAVVPSGIFVPNTQTLRGGIGPVTVPLANSQPAVGSLKPTALTFNPGDARATATFTPAASGNTILTITPPTGFVSSPALSQLVVVVN